jgi:hypothetical protein
MKILGLHPVHVGMLLLLRLTVGESAIPFKSHAPLCDGGTIKNSESSLVQRSHQCGHDSASFSVRQTHQLPNGCRKLFHYSFKPRIVPVSRLSIPFFPMGRVEGSLCDSWTSVVLPQAVSKTLGHFPMFSCRVLKAGLDFPQIVWHAQKHQSCLVYGQNPPRLKNLPVASETFRNFLHRWKTLAKKAFLISTRPGRERSYNSASASAAHLARNPQNSKNIGTTDFSWTDLRVRSRASPLSRPLLLPWSKKNVICNAGLPLNKSLLRRRPHRYLHPPTHR